MPKPNPVQRSPSGESIDIEKPEGIASFWNLFSKSNKKYLKNSKSVKKDQMKASKSNLNQLNTNYANTQENIKDNKRSTLQNNFILVQKEEIDGLIGDRLLRNFMRKGNALNESKLDKGKIITSSTISFSVQSNMSCKQSFKTENVKTKKANARTHEISDLIHKNMDNICRKISRKSILFKSVPSSTLKQKRRKRVYVPIYIGGKISDDMSTIDREKIAVSSKNSLNSVHTTDIPSILNKIADMEENLSDLEHKARKMKTVISKKYKQKVDSHLKDSNNMTTNVQHAADDLYTNNTGLKKNVIKSNNEDCWSTVYKSRAKSNVVRGQHINPKVLIKNHNLVIPRDISQESLFQANPHAGCDTILNLYKVLSQETHPNRSKTSVDLKNKSEYKDRFQSKSQRTKKESSTNKTDQNLKLDFDYESKTVTVNNGDNFEFKNKSPCISSQRNYRNSPVKYNRVSDIFSLPLPMPLNREKTANTCSPLNDEFHTLLQETKMVQKDGTSIYTTDNSTGTCDKKNQDGSKERTTKNIAIQTHYNQNIDIVKVLSSDLQKCKTLEKNIGREDTERERIQKGVTFLKNANLLHKFKSLSYENSLNKVTTNVKEHLSIHKLKKCSSSCENNLSAQLIDAEINLRGNCKVNIDKLILKKVPEKQVRKTTLPLLKTKVEEPQLSITLCMENNLNEKINKESKICPVKGILQNDQTKELIKGKSPESLNKYVKFSFRNFNEKNTNPNENLSANLIKSSALNNNGIITDMKLHNIKEKNTETETKTCPRRDFTYLNKEQRKEFDKKNVCKVKTNKPNNENSIDLSTLKIILKQNSYSHPNYGLDYKENTMKDSKRIKKLEQSIPDYTQSKLKIQSKTRKSVSRIPFYFNNLNSKKRSRAQMIHKANTDSFHKNILCSSRSDSSQSYKTESSEDQNIITQNKTNLTSLEDNNKPNNLNNRDYESRNKQHLTIKIKENTTIGKDFNTSDKKKRSCRYNLTLNQEPLLKNVNSKVFSFFPNVSIGDHHNNDGKLLQTNVDITGKQCYQSKITGQQTNISLADTQNLKYTQYSEPLQNPIATNIVCNPVMTFNPQCDFNFCSKRTQSTELLMNEIIYLGKYEDSFESSKDYLKGSQYQKIGSLWNYISDDPRYSQNRSSKDPIEGQQFDKENYDLGDEIEKRFMDTESHLRSFQCPKEGNRIWSQISHGSKYYQNNSCKEPVEEANPGEPNFKFDDEIEQKLQYIKSHLQNLKFQNVCNSTLKDASKKSHLTKSIRKEYSGDGCEKPNFNSDNEIENNIDHIKSQIKNIPYQKLIYSVLKNTYNESENPRENSVQDFADSPHCEKQNKNCDSSNFKSPFDDSKILFKSNTEPYGDSNKDTIDSNYKASQIVPHEGKKILTIPSGVSENDSTAKSNEDSFSYTTISDSENTCQSCCPCLPSLPEDG